MARLEDVVGDRASESAEPGAGLEAAAASEAPARPHAAPVPEAAVELEAAMKAGGAVWLRPDTSTTGGALLPPTTGPVWYVWSDGAGYLLTGPGEQPLPGIVAGSRCAITARNSTGGRAITWTGMVEALDPAGSEWAAVAPKLAAARLNGGDPVVAVPTWPGRLTILVLRPTGDQATAPDGMPDDSQAAPPLPSPATTPYRMPSDITRGWRRRAKARKTNRT